MIRLAAIIFIVILVAGGRAEAAPYLVIQHGHTATITSAVVSADGRFAATAAADASLRVWELAGGRLLMKIDNERPISAVALAPSDRHKLAIGDSSGRIRTWNLATETELEPLEDCTAPARAIAFSPSGNELVAICPTRQEESGISQTGVLWRFAPEGEESAITAKPIELQEKILAATFVRGTDLPSLLLASDRARVLDFDPATLDARAPFSPALNSELGGAATIAAFASNAPVSLLASASGDVCVIAPPERPKTCARLAGAPITAATLFEDGSKGAIASTGGTVCVFDAAMEKKCLATRTFNRGTINALAFAPDGRLLVTAGTSAIFWEWHAQDAPDVVLSGSNARGQTFALSRSGRWLLTANGPGAVVWDLDRGRPIARVPLPPGQEIRLAAWSPGSGAEDGASLVILLGDGTLRVWNRRESGLTGAPIKTELTKLAWSNDGKQLFGGTADGRVYLFSGEGKPVLQFTAAPVNSSCNLAALEPVPGTAPRWMTATSDGQITLWDLSTKTAVRTIIAPAEPGCALVYAIPRTNGGAIAVLRDGKVLRWRPETRGGKKLLVKDLLDVVPGAPMATAAGWPEASLFFVAPTRGTPALFAGEGKASPIEHGGQSERILAAAVRKNQIWMLEPDGELVIAGKDRNWLASMVTHTDGSWAVIDPQNRIDASGDVPGVHWVDELQALTLRQLEGDPCAGPLWPGLLAVRLGRKAESAIAPKAAPELVRPPSIGDPFLAAAGTNARSCAKAEPILLRKLGDPSAPVLCIPFEAGAKGNVALEINGRPIPERLDITADHVAFDLLKHLELANQGSNIIDVEVTSPSGVAAFAQWSASEEVRGQRSRPKQKKVEPPKSRFFALVVGVDDYEGTLALSYPHHDARDLSRVLRALAAAEFEDVKVKCIATATGCEGRGTKQEIERAFAWLSEETTRADVVVIYLAGHGDVATRCNSPHYYFLGAGAGTAALTDPAQRSRVAISAKQLEEAMIRIHADRKLLILETCKAGATLHMGWPLGTIVLAANGADAASYGSGRLSHGYLAHAILEKLHTGEVRDASGRIDVWKLIASAGERASFRAREDGKMESPLLTTQNIELRFDLGRVTAANEKVLECKRHLPALYYSQGAGLEESGLGKKIGFAFRTSSANSVSFRDTDSHREAKYRVQCTGKPAGSGLIVQLTVERENGETTTTALARRPGEDPTVFAARIAEWTLAHLGLLP